MSSEKVNILTLSLAQGVKLAFLLFSIFISTRISNTAWGEYTIAQSFFLWIGLIIEYGFNLYGVNKLSITSYRKEDIPTYNRMSSEIYSGRIIIGFLVAVIVISIYLSGVIQNIISPIFLIVSYIGAFAYNLLPTWHFQFRGKIFIVALIDIVVYTISALSFLLVLFLHASILLSSIIQSIMCIVAGFFGWLLISGEIGRPSFSIFVGFIGIKNSFSLFIYNSSIGIYTAGSNILIGLLFGVGESGIFSSAERIIRIINSVLSPFIKTYFPKMSYLFANDKLKYNSYFTRIIVISIVSLSVLALTSYFLSDFVSGLIYNYNSKKIAKVIRILSFTIVLVNLSSILSFFWILPAGLSRNFNVITIISAALNTILMFLAANYKVFGYAWSIVVTELFVFLSLTVILYLSSKGEKK